MIAAGGWSVAALCVVAFVGLVLAWFAFPHRRRSVTDEHEDEPFAENGKPHDWRWPERRTIERGVTRDE